MTNDELMEFAVAAGIVAKLFGTDYKPYCNADITNLQKFADLVSAHAITSMQGNSEPIYQVLIKGEGWFDVQKEDFEQADDSYKRILFTHDRVKGVSDSENQYFLSEEFNTWFKDNSNGLRRDSVYVYKQLKDALFMAYQAGGRQLSAPCDNDAIDGQDKGESV